MIYMNYSHIVLFMAAIEVDWAYFFPHISLNFAFIADKSTETGFYNVMPFANVLQTRTFIRLHGLTTALSQTYCAKLSTDLTNTFSN